MSGRAFVPTDIGKIVSKFLVKYLGDYVEYSFTAQMEDVLDEISNGEKEWHVELGRFWKPFIKSVQHITKSVSREEVAESREVGRDPVSGKPIAVRMGQYGPFVQQGTRDDVEKPRFASLLPGQHMDDVTLDDALKLLSLPRDLGQAPDGTPISVGRGQYGPYVKFGAKYASIKEDDPFTLTLPRALEIVDAKLAADRERTIKDFPDNGIQILKGRYGPYVTDKKRNAKVPKDREPASLTLEDARPCSPPPPSARAASAGAETEAPAAAAAEPATGAKIAKPRARKKPAVAESAAVAPDKPARPAKPKAAKKRKSHRQGRASRRSRSRRLSRDRSRRRARMACRAAGKPGGSHRARGWRRALQPRPLGAPGRRRWRVARPQGRRTDRTGRRQFLGSIGHEPSRLRDV